MSNKPVGGTLSSAAGARGDLDARYRAFFDLFSRQRFFEAHEVLEDLWLSDRHGPNGAFYKGLIQLAAAFVHLQKNRLSPAAALLKRARALLEPYPARHEQLDVASVLTMADDWLRRLDPARSEANPLSQACAPRIALLADGERESLRPR